MIPEIDIWRAANLMLKRYGEGPCAARGTWLGRTLRRHGGRQRNESTWSVKRPGGRLVRELANGVGDPAPHG